MFGAGTLTFQEFMKRETLPLAAIQNVVLEFLQVWPPVSDLQDAASRTCWIDKGGSPVLLSICGHERQYGIFRRDAAGVP